MKHYNLTTPSHKTDTAFQKPSESRSTAQCKGFKARTDYPLPAAQKDEASRLPGGLKAGIENLSGIAMEDVRVHYHSGEPAKMQALAYARGMDIFVSPGQEKHLPHEAWHVVQQRQGRVKPTMLSEGVALNDDAGLEHEADRMGKRALDMSRPALREVSAGKGSVTTGIVQRVGEHLQTGLKKDVAVGRFAGKLKSRFSGGKNPLGSTKQWSTLSNQERADKLVKYANAELAKANIPKLKGAVLNPVAAQPSFGFPGWNIELVGDLSRTDTPYLEWLADAVYHESRHAEQWFRMARLLAGQGKTATEIATGIGIQDDVAKKAIKRPLKAQSKVSKAFHSKGYNDRQATKMQEADDWYQSVYGTGKVHRDAVLTAPVVDQAQYLALPEEVDAYIVGPKAMAKFQALMAGG